MSMNFENPMNKEALEMFRKMIADGEFPEPVAQDDRRALFDDALTLNQKKMGDLARAAKQPVTVEFNTEGEIKKLSDGTKYRVTKHGWQKIDA